MTVNVNVSALILHIGAIILFAGIVTMYIWRKENDARKAKFGLMAVLAGAAITIISFAAIELGIIVLWSV